MLDFYIMWTYHANYSENPICIRARSAKEAVQNFTKFYSDDFRKNATVYAFTELPVSVFKKGSFISKQEESHF